MWEAGWQVLWTLKGLQITSQSMGAALLTHHGCVHLQSESLGGVKRPKQFTEQLLTGWTEEQTYFLSQCLWHTG